MQHSAKLAIGRWRSSLADRLGDEGRQRGTSLDLGPGLRTGQWPPPEDQAVWDGIAAVRGGVRGPFGVLMHVPQLADHVRALEHYFRFDGEYRRLTASW